MFAERKALDYDQLKFETRKKTNKQTNNNQTNKTNEQFPCCGSRGNKEQEHCATNVP